MTKSKTNIYILNPDNITKVENVRLGSDPEFFLRDKTTGQYKSAIGLIGGTKDLPRFIKAGYGVQEDNVALELTLPPTNDYKKMYNDCIFIIDFINKELASKGINLEVVNDDSADAVIFDEEELDNHIAQVFGCSPSFNCWDLNQNQSPKANEANLRSIGKHLHVSYKDMNYETSINLLRILDLFVTVPSIILNPNGALRRQLYGKAGEHRIGAVTAELRTPGINWFQSVEYTEWMFNNVFAAIQAHNEGFVIDQHLDDCEAIISCINTNDVHKAQYLCDKYNINLKINQENNLKTINQVICAE